MTESAFLAITFSEENLNLALSNDHFRPNEVKKHARAAYLFRYLRDLGAQSIVVENSYIDGDYLDDFANYYVKCFDHYLRWCKRLHFFSNAVDSASLVRAARGDIPPSDEQALKDSYLGFVVARPLPSAIVGRTVLRTYPADGGRRNYTCLRKYRANLFGIDLVVQSLAFQEQDTVLAACATVALWSCFHKTAELFGASAPSPAEITRAANQVRAASRPLPSHGLIVEQICTAIAAVGLEPEVIRVTGGVALVSLMYGYLSMGAPVVLVVDVEGRGLHAVTVVGFSLLADRVREQEVAPGDRAVPMAGLRINEFYAHDDQIGPFSRLEVKPSTAQAGVPVTFEGGWEDNETGKRLTLSPKLVIVPVYHKIRVTFLDIQEWLFRLDLLISIVLNKDTEREWNVNLSMTNSLKKQVRMEREIPDEERERLLLKNHPRFVWRLALKVSKKTVLEFLADATGIARSFPLYDAIWHEGEWRNRIGELLSSKRLADTLGKVLTPPLMDFLVIQCAGGSLSGVQVPSSPGPPPAGSEGR